MKIAIVSIIREPWGGSEELWAACALEALKSGHEVIISLYDCGSLSPKTKILVNKGAKIDLRIGTIQKNLSPWRYIIKRARRIYYTLLGNPFSKLLSSQPDVLLYVGTAYSIAKDYKLLQSVKRNNPYFFINVQLNYEQNKNILSERDKAKITEAFHLAKKIFFVSERNKEVAEFHLDFKIKNGIVVRNPVNLPSIELIPYPSLELIQIGMVGNLTVIHKGQDTVLKVLAADKWRNGNWHLNIYGAGDDELQLRKMVVMYKLDNKVTFHGKTSDIRLVWEKNHILLMPSHMEGMSLAVVEAMLCGRPPVVTDVGGHREWIEDEKEGWIASHASVESFEEAMTRAWQNMSHWERIGAAAHQKAMTLYDPEPGKTLLKLIENNLQN